jgi:hypothetical protein
MEAGISDSGFPRAQGEEGKECISQLSSAVERRHSDDRIKYVYNISLTQASLLWSDTTYEKCWHGWSSFKNEEKRRRSERMLKHHQLAGKIVQLNFLLCYVSQPKIDK